jgi:hypothetical protein
MRELARWLPELAPPPGGAERLVRALAAPATGRGAWLREHAPTFATVVAVALTSGIVWRALRPPVDEARVTRCVELVVAAPTRVRVAGGGAIEQPSPRADVRLYLVMTVDRDPDP